jgi:hypothetical protein
MRLCFSLSDTAGKRGVSNGEENNDNLKPENSRVCLVINIREKRTRARKI